MCLDLSNAPTFGRFVKVPWVFQEGNYRTSFKSVKVEASKPSLGLLLTQAAKSRVFPKNQQSLDRLDSSLPLAAEFSEQRAF